MDRALLTKEERKKIEELEQEKKDNQEIISKMSARSRDWNSSQRTMNDRNNKINDMIRRIEFGDGIISSLYDGIKQLEYANEVYDEIIKDWKLLLGNELDLNIFLYRVENKVSGGKAAFANMQRLMRNMKYLNERQEKPELDKYYMTSKYY